MKPDDLLNYALDQLEGPHKEAIESEIAVDAILAARAERLGRALHLLLDDGDPDEPPLGLSSRTVAFVAERTSRRAILDFIPARVPFRWADVAVAAGVLLAGLLTLLPAMSASRGKMNQMGCAFNLQQLGASLAHYANRHNHYPDVCSDDSTGDHVGHYAVALKDENLLRDLRSLHCPCRGKCPDIIDLKHIDYAYNVGFRPEAQSDPEPIMVVPAAVIPILADQPPHDNRSVLPGNSPNHGFRGQNVLFSDLHVEWFSSRRVKLDKDVFLNDQERPEPGLGLHDSALVPAVFQLETY